MFHSNAGDDNDGV